MERRKFGTEPAAKDGISTVKRWATLKAGIRNPESRNRIPELRMMAEKFTLAINKMSFSLQLQPQTVTVKNMTRFQQQPYAIYPTQFFKRWITLSI